MKKIIVICALVSLIPIGIIGAGACWVVQKQARFETYKKVKGEIISLDTKREGKYDVVNDAAYYPKIGYADDHNEMHVIALKIGSNPPLGKVGERIDLLVNPQKPDDAVINSFMYKWFGPTVILIIGFLLLTVVSIVSAHLIIREQKQGKNAA